MIKLIALDRDGVINQDSPFYIKSLQEWQPIAGAASSIATLKKCGYLVIVVTNQSGLGRGLFSVAALNSIHQQMLKEIRAAGGDLDAIFYCPHTPNDHCDCRKPKPGMLLRAAAQFHIKPTEILMIGDSMRDMFAAKQCGATSIFIKTGSEKAKDLACAKKDNFMVYSSLQEATTKYIQQLQPPTMENNIV